MFGATEHILSSSLSHSAGTRRAVRAKMDGSWPGAGRSGSQSMDERWDGLVSRDDLLQPSASSS